jgi:hypothetical protein
MRSRVMQKQRRAGKEQVNGSGPLASSSRVESEPGADWAAAMSNSAPPRRVSGCLRERDY